MQINIIQITMKLEATWEDQNIIQIYGVDRRLNYTSKVGYATIIWYAFVSKYTELRYVGATQIHYSVGERINRNLWTQHTALSAALRSQNAWREAGKPDPTVIREESQIAKTNSQ